MHPLWIALLTLALLGPLAAQTSSSPGQSLPAQQAQQPDHSNEHLDDPNWLGPFVPTPEAVVVAALELAGVGANDRLYDLGSGDGRIIVTAAQQFQARAVGIEWDQELCDKTTAEIHRLGLDDTVSVIQGDIFKQDVGAATVVTAYLLPKSWDRLAPILEKQLASGARVVSINDAVPGWPVIDQKELPGRAENINWKLYLYRMP